MKDKRILVCGANGISGKAAMRVCLSLGATVLLSDQKLPIESSDDLGLGSKWRASLIDLRPRQEPQILFQHSVDLIIIAPGVPRELEILQIAQEKGISIRSENDFGFEHLLKKYEQENKEPPYVIAVTGTDGKSTTTALLSALINESTRLTAVPCGNFGRPLCDLVLTAESPDVLVVECSSFQLECVERFHPHTALFLNLEEDHSDRYSTKENYFQAKLNITDNQGPDDLLILSERMKSEIMTRLKRRQAARTHGSGKLPRCSSLEAIGTSESFLYFGDMALLKAKELKLRGLHNFNNVAFALTALKELNLRRGVPFDLDRLKKALTSFKGLQHRLEYIGALPLAQGHRLECYNDSKATTVQAVNSALQSFPRQHVFLLCGGRAKGDAFSALNRTGLTLDIFSFGEAGPMIARAVRVKAVLPDLERAFEAARNAAENYSKEQYFASHPIRPPFVLLLSPGCASFDAYQNYAQRGEHFRQLVHQRRIS